MISIFRKVIRQNFKPIHNKIFLKQIKLGIKGNLLNLKRTI
jgi:hypothetical protein